MVERLMVLSESGSEMAVGVGQLRRRAGAHPLPAAAWIRIIPKTDT
jgi:hypothetical protein